MPVLPGVICQEITVLFSPFITYGVVSIIVWYYHKSKCAKVLGFLQWNGLQWNLQASNIESLS
jgi:hypothetical protein